MLKELIKTDNVPSVFLFLSLNLVTLISYNYIKHVFKLEIVNNFGNILQWQKMNVLTSPYQQYVLKNFKNIITTFKYTLLLLVSALLQKEYSLWPFFKIFVERKKVKNV